MVTFTKIECVEKTDDLITGIYGTIAPQSSDSQPTKGRIRAIDEAKGPVFYKDPNTAKELIIEFRAGNNGTKNFFIPHPDNPGNNFLATFPECV